MPRVVIACSLAFSVLYGVLGLSLAARQSATKDEVPHIGAGYAYLRGDLRLNIEHPPVVKVLAALGMPERGSPLALPPEGAPSSVEWSFGNQVLHEAREAPLVLLAGARAPIVCLAALLIPLLALFAFRLAGTVAACASAFFAALCPLWLAHGSLVTTDAASALSIFAAAYAAFVVLHVSPQRRAASGALLCVVIAFGLAVKYSSVVGMAFVTLAALWDAHRAGKLRAVAPTLLISSALGVVLGVTFAWGWPPSPERYLAGLRAVGGNHAPGYPFYAFGELSRDRHPLYFVAALGVKVSVSVLALALASPWLRRAFAVGASEARGGALIWLPAAGHLLAFSAAAPALGVRYVLPVLPFLILHASLALSALGSRKPLRWVAAVLIALHVWAAGESLYASPLAYFNGLGCRTGQLPPCLDDSNVDWGHALPALREARDALDPNAHVRIFYFGSSLVSAYVPNARAAEPMEIVSPFRALYAVSLHSFARSPSVSWVRHVPPTRVVAGAYALYDLRAVSTLQPPP